MNTIERAVASHKAELRLKGYLIWEPELAVVAGNDTRVAATLQPEQGFPVFSRNRRGG
jgi:hypothetical protein